MCCILYLLADICWKHFPQVVLADGRVARVTSRSALVENENGTRVEYKYTNDTDLWFAMRGAGSSYGTNTCFYLWFGDKCFGETLSGIVTEFLYKVYPRPEVKPHKKYQLELGRYHIATTAFQRLLSNVWDDTEGAAHCDTSDTRLCPRLPSVGARSSGNQKIPLQVQTLHEQVHLWSINCFSALTQLDDTRMVCGHLISFPTVCHM